MDINPSNPSNPKLEVRSPWSNHNDKKLAAIHPAQTALSGTVRAAGSKSLTNRALLIAALAKGRSQIDGILKGDDSYWCIDSLIKLGVQVDVRGDTAYVEGCGGVWPNRSGTIFVGAAGTVARFLPATLAAGQGIWTITGSTQLAGRPLAPLLGALTELGARIERHEPGLSVPFTLEANGLRGGSVTLPGSTSSQFISGLLLAAPYAAEPLTIRIDGEVVQRDYVELTLGTMAQFGIAAQFAEDGQSISVPKGKYEAQQLRLEPDVSTCCYYWASAALTGGRVRVEGVDASATRQPDIELLRVLEEMGCTVIRGPQFVEVVGPTRLKGNMEINMHAWSDQTLTLAAMAPFADGPITLTGAAHIRQHECDRIAAICTELRRLGIRVEERHDGLTVYPGEPVPATLDSYDDHRMAMALSLIGTRVGNIRIADPGCVSKTCPDFFEKLSTLGVNVEFGMKAGEQNVR